MIYKNRIRGEARFYLEKSVRAEELEHAENVAKEAEQICKEFNSSKKLREIIFPAAYLHDIGWYEVAELCGCNKNTMLLAHMKFGAKLAKEILERVYYSKKNKEKEFKRDKKIENKISHICYLIREHEIPGHNSISTEMIILREADERFELEEVYNEYFE